MQILPSPCPSFVYDSGVGVKRAWCVSSKGLYIRMCWERQCDLRTVGITILLGLMVASIGSYRCLDGHVWTHAHICSSVTGPRRHPYPNLWYPWARQPMWQSSLEDMIKLRVLRWLDDPGLSQWTTVTTRLLVRGTEECQGSGKEMWWKQRWEGCVLKMEEATTINVASRS